MTHTKPRLCDTMLIIHVLSAPISFFAHSVWLVCVCVCVCTLFVYKSSRGLPQDSLRM